MLTVSAPQREFYRREGYLHLRGVLPPDLLDLTELVLGRWADETIAQWLEEGLIADRRRDLDFQHRLVRVWHEAGRPMYIRSPRRDLVSPHRSPRRSAGLIWSRVEGAGSLQRATRGRGAAERP